ncbi:hypothetical protein F0L68_40675 [Solihabitans fulvus]|uniref:Uncharacterized protein n=1 Tax=Solihabitans fulvus TaxID=1892852 RepID=A0A5B2W7U9_9PSEU|nr:hypothetical protein [Solihabitans fulvus]KAA2246407.1 hypothetical protein F0L68_40675 [Solihabitans fulvus]
MRTRGSRLRAPIVACGVGVYWTVTFVGAGEILTGHLPDHWPSTTLALAMLGIVLAALGKLVTRTNLAWRWILIGGAATMPLAVIGGANADSTTVGALILLGGLANYLHHRAYGTNILSVPTRRR